MEHITRVQLSLPVSPPHGVCTGHCSLLFQKVLLLHVPQGSGTSSIARHSMRAGAAASGSPPPPTALARGRGQERDEQGPRRRAHLHDGNGSWRPDPLFCEARGGAATLSARAGAIKQLQRERMRARTSSHSRTSRPPPPAALPDARRRAPTTTRLWAAATAGGVRTGGRFLLSFRKRDRELCSSGGAPAPSVSLGGGGGVRGGEGRTKTPQPVRQGGGAIHRFWCERGGGVTVEKTAGLGRRWSWRVRVGHVG